MDRAAPPLPSPLIGPEGHDPMWDEIRWVGDVAMYYDRTGTPITLRQWVTGVEDPEYRWVKRTRVGNVSVVTAWNGLNGALWPETPPEIFGTIEIHGDGEDATYHDEETDCTESDALATHDRRVAKLRKELP
jgi:hypothetical protein